MALMSLNINPMVSPTILKGNRISHSKGRRNNMISANGQQVTSRRHQRINARIVFIVRLCYKAAND